MTKKSGRKHVLVAVAWPYANGSLHLGHVAGSLLPPDIFARYHRAVGNHVLMVSGSDCHGTPIMVTADEQSTTPAKIVERYHAEHVKSLKDLAIDFDLFTKTTTENHRALVQDIFTTLLSQKYLEEREMDATYCVNEKRFLPDRYVEGTCPHCGSTEARGDQCDACGKTLDPTELKDARCRHCGEPPEVRATRHFFFRLPAFEDRLKTWVKDKSAWRPNTINFTNNWLREGLKDRPISRDLTWGVPIPLEGYDDKRLYVWFEAVCGYFTASVEWSERIAKQPDAWKRWWLDPEAETYYFLGKDNIPFHTIIWPAILMGYSDGLVASKRAPRPLNLPTDVPANEFLTLSGKQFSKSRGIGIGIPDMVARFDPDVIRYYLSINMPEAKDTDWSWDDFVSKINDELVGTFGNYAHRVLSFVHKHYGQAPEAGKPTPEDADALLEIENAIREVGEHIGACRFKKALRRTMRLAQFSNRFIDTMAPWKLVTTDKKACGQRLAVALRLAHALAVLMQPFIPRASQRLWRSLGQEGDASKAAWSSAGSPVAAGTVLPAPKILFEKLELEDIIGGDQDMNKEAAGAKDATVTIEEFAKVQLRIGRIVSVEDHPDADKLLVLKLDEGDGKTRQVVAGIKGHYTKEGLNGRTIAFVANLKPATIRGVESQGMILAAEDDKSVSVLSPDDGMAPGAKIR